MQNDCSSRLLSRRSFLKTTAIVSGALALPARVLADAAAGKGAAMAAIKTSPLVYVSPLKALVYDIERNLQSPLQGIRHAAARLGTDIRDIEVDVRTGDTPARDRQRQRRKPADILVTTPESLYLLLTSQARETLRCVETVIVDEIHVMAGSKRGVHLALSLERLAKLCSGVVLGAFSGWHGAIGPLRVRQSPCVRTDDPNGQV